MQGKVCIVTGGNSGIGKVTATALAKAGATVVIVGRSRERVEGAARELQRQTGNTRVETLLVDMASQASIRAGAAEFRQRFDRLDVLVNNAGQSNDRCVLTKDGVETTLAVNHVGYFLFTMELLDLLKRSAPSRIINVASAVHKRVPGINWEDINLTRRYRPDIAYGQSKLANILFTYELARRLEGTGVTVNCVHPGLVATNIWQGSWSGKLIGLILRWKMITPEEGARDMIRLATDPDLAAATGQYWARGKARESSPASYDRAAAERLWTWTEQAVGGVS